MNSQPKEEQGPSDLGVRLDAVLRRANLTPRNLGGATRVHWVTIYAIIRGDHAKSTPLVQHTLGGALDKIEALTKEGTLPFRTPMRRREQTEILTKLLNS